MSEDSLVKDLYTLVGEYNATMRTVFNELKEINEKFDINFQDHELIKKTLIDVDKKVTDNERNIKVNENRLNTMELTGLPKKTKTQLDMTTIVTFLNTLATLFLQLIGRA